MPKNRAEKVLSEEPAWQAELSPSFVFRPIHYLGSKLRVLAAIEQAVDEVDPSGGPVCDLFSGSATVSRYLSQRRQVVAVDIQEYARTLAEAVLNGDTSVSVKQVERELDEYTRLHSLQLSVEPLATLEALVAQRAEQGRLDPLCGLLELGSLAGLTPDNMPSDAKLCDAIRTTLGQLDALGLPGSDTVCIRHFGGSYFSYAQAAELDALACFARKKNSPFLLAAALSTASYLVNSIGKQFAQPIRPRDKFGLPKRHVVKKIVTERALSARKIFLGYLQSYEDLAFTRRDHVAVRSDFRDALASPALRPSVVYADPPYTRDHYSRFYHTLETLALGDDPTITRSNLGGGLAESRGSYRSGRHQSPFCIKSEAPGAFSALFAGVAALKAPLVLSYSGYDPTKGARPRVMALDDVVMLAREHFSNVRVDVLDSIEHMKLNTVSLNKGSKTTTEVLLICQ